MADFWTVVGSVAGVGGIAWLAYLAGVKRGSSKTKCALADERRMARFTKIYAPADALFLTRHITTASGRLAPYFSQRFTNAKEILFENGNAINAIKALFDKQELEEVGEVEREWGSGLASTHVLSEMSYCKT